MFEQGSVRLNLEGSGSKKSKHVQEVPVFSKGEETRYATLTVTSKSQEQEPVVKPSQKKGVEVQDAHEVSVVRMGNLSK